MPKKYLLHTVLGLGLGGFLCWMLMNHAHLTAPMVAALSDGFNPFMLVCVVVLTPLLMDAGTRKWAYLDEHFDGHAPQPYYFYLRHYIWQSWLAQILPSSVAMIAGRALVTHTTEARNWQRGLRSGFVDQLSELFAVVAFIPATLWQLQTGCGWLEWLVLGIVTLLVATWLGAKILPRYVLPVVMFWSWLRVTLITLRLIVGAQVFSLPIASSAIAYAMPLATLTVIIPITPGNLGVSEWGWAYALGLWQVDYTQAALYLISFRLLALAVQSVSLFALPLLRAR